MFPLFGFGAKVAPSPKKAPESRPSISSMGVSDLLPSMSLDHIGRSPSRVAAVATLGGNRRQSRVQIDDDMTSDDEDLKPLAGFAKPHANQGIIGEVAAGLPKPQATLGISTLSGFGSEASPPSSPPSKPHFSPPSKSADASAALEEQVADLRAKIVELQQAKELRLQEEDYMGAHHVKQMIQEQEDKLKALLLEPQAMPFVRRILGMAPTQLRSLLPGSTSLTSVAPPASPPRPVAQSFLQPGVQSIPPIQVQPAPPQALKFDSVQPEPAVKPSASKRSFGSSLCMAPMSPPHSPVSAPPPRKAPRVSLSIGGPRRSKSRTSLASVVSAAASAAASSPGAFSTDSPMVAAAAMAAVAAAQSTAVKMAQSSTMAVTCGGVGSTPVGTDDLLTGFPTSPTKLSAASASAMQASPAPMDRFGAMGDPGAVEESRSAFPVDDDQSDAEEEDAEPIEGELMSGEWRAATRGSDSVMELPPKEDAEQGTFRLKRDTYDKLFDYQRDGVAWMAQLWQTNQGGILADEMGLGKTIQVCGLLNGVRKSGATHALLLLPISLLDQWSREAKVWCPGWPVYIYYGSPAQRAQALRRVMRPAGGLLLTSYSMILNVTELLQVSVADAPTPKSRGRKAVAYGVKRAGPGAAKRKRLDDDDAEDGDESDSGPREVEIPETGLPDLGVTRPWDIVICDEAHRMKNISTLLGKSLRQLSAKCRLLLTGTPVQNALQDLWALMDFAQPGLLGNHATFVKTFSDPIDRGSVRGAKVWAVELKKHLSEQLRTLISPHILRRTKMGTGLLQAESADECAGAAASEMEVDDENSNEPRKLVPKKETIVWLHPSEEQTMAYQKILERSEVIREACQKQKLGIEVFRAIGLLKRLCNHPVLALPAVKPGAWAELLSEAMAAGSGQNQECQEDDEVPLTQDAPEESLANGTGQDDARGGRAVEQLLKKMPRSLEALLDQSAKLRCMNVLLPALAAKGHRTLIFSQSVKMLDLTQACCLKPNGLRCLRIDGQTDAATRSVKVNKFNKETQRFQCMCLTTSVGGVGLNLVSADRVILIDPAWNPATDAQAVDRAFRIGQEKEVRVYRLIMSGLIEDKMFRLQVFKMGLTKTALEADQKHNYFTAREIKALFDWTDPAEGETRKLLKEKHGGEAESAVNKLAEEDGSTEGWLNAGPAVGLSDFGSLYGSIAQGADDEDEQDDASAALVVEAKEKLSAADDKLAKATEGRQKAEAHQEQTKKELEESVTACELSKEKLSQTAESLKERRSEMRAARNNEVAAQQRTEKTMKAKAATQDALLGAQQNALAAAETAHATSGAVVEAVAAAKTAEEVLTKVLSDAEAQINIVNFNGKAVGNSLVDASSEKVRKALKAMEKGKSTWEILVTRQGEADACEEDLVKAEKSLGEAQQAFAKLGRGLGEDDSMAGTADAQAAIARKGAELNAKNREKERSRCEQALAKTIQKCDAARENFTNAVQTLSENGVAFADSFTKAQGKTVRMDQVKAAQSATKAPFRQFTSSILAVKRARDSVTKALALRRKAVQKSSVVVVAEVEGAHACADAEREYSDAVSQEEARRNERESSDAALSAAETARINAEAEDLQAKKCRDELKAAVPVAKEAVRVAKASEKEALSERQSLHAKCSKVEKEKLYLEEAKSSAVQMLKAEEYDPNQVESAYAKKNAD